MGIVLSSMLLYSPVLHAQSVYDLEAIRTEDGTRNEKGHGLGLMLCKKLITMNRGELMVQSTPDQGSDFHIILPVAVLDQSE